MLHVIEHGEIVELKMDRPPANALNIELVERLTNAHAESCQQGARAIILSGREGMFSAGLDVPELIELDRNEMHQFWCGFLGLTRVLAASPIPVVAALGGHSPAGGTVLAIHCDYRIAVTGNFKMGLNEVQVGLPVPSAILFAFARLIGNRLAQQYAVRGRLIPVDQALSVGLVDELCEMDELTERALAWCQSIIALPSMAMTQTRKLCMAPLIEALDSTADADVVTDYWFSEETQVAMRALIEALKK